MRTYTLKIIINHEIDFNFLAEILLDILKNYKNCKTLMNMI